jgi:N-acetyl-anhydromuramyl-L-alanine amidase AmpD
MSDALPTQEQADAFWSQMATFSGRVYRSLDLPSSGSPNGDPDWRTSGKRGPQPSGAALHWTASDSIVSTLKWFCDPASKVSAHMVVADRLLPWAEPMLDGLPLVAALPATAVTCRKPEQTAWHVRNMDHTLFGIENVNVGTLSGRNNTLSWVAGTTPRAYRSDKPAITCFGGAFEPYTQSQLQANVDILRYANATYGNTLQRALVLGHSCFQASTTGFPREDKRDPGPQFPIKDIRHAVFVPDARTLPDGIANAGYPLVWRAQIARQAMYGFRQREGRYSQSGLNKITATADAKIWLAFVISCSRAKDVENYPVLAYGMMACLGFACGPDATDEDVDTSLRMCQRLLGVTQDGIIGLKTSTALTTRFRNLFVGVSA